MSDSSVRVNFSSGIATEPLRGYSRAVRIGPHLYISGMTAMNEKSEVIGLNDPYAQTKYALENIRAVLKAADFQIEDVVRTRLFVTDMRKWNDYARAHREMFEKVRPASCIVEVSRLLDARLLIEIEAEAVLGCRDGEPMHISLKAGTD